MAYDASRLLELSVNITKIIEPDDLFSTILKEAMYITNSDGGTIYMPSREGLKFQYVLTKSKYVEMGRSSGATSLPAIPMDRNHACACVAITQKNLNIRDVYYTKGYDFRGTYEYDKSNSYRSHSMLIVPMSSCFELIGVLQLINSLDESSGQWRPFTEVHEKYVSYLASMAATKIENMKLKGAFDEKKSRNGRGLR